MYGENKSGMQCTEFDALLAEAIDGTLGGEQLARFEQHKAACPACGAMFAEVSSGVNWLETLEEIDPPANLVHNVLAATLGATESAALAAPRMSFWERLQKRASVTLAPVLTPRFAMSMGMAFFSVTLVLNMAQIRITDLTPHNISHTFYTSQNKVLKYYENMRVVYEIESRVRDLRNANVDEDRERERKQRRPEQKDQTNERNENSEPDRHERERYSNEMRSVRLASLEQDLLYFGKTAKQRRES